MQKSRELSPDFDENIIRQTSEHFGIARETCKTGWQWAKEWQRTLEVTSHTGIEDRAVLMAARDLADQEMGQRLDRDSHGIPTYRTQIAAQEMFLSLNEENGEAYRRLLEPPGPTVMPNFRRLDEVLDTLLSSRERGVFPYSLDAARLPQDESNMPPSLPRGGIEHASFLFATCYYMRGGIKSTAAFRSLSRLYEQDPKLFDADAVRHESPETISRLLSEIGLAYKKDEVGRAWVENATRIHKRYDGDPRNIFAGSPSYEELLKRVMNDGGVQGFLGFREKMTSMLAYYLMAEELVPYYDVPLPVDFHVLRVSASTGIITFENLPKNGNIYHQKTLDVLRAIYHDYSVTHGVSQIDVCNAVWSLSSAICGEQPGNRMSEPNRVLGRDGRNTEIVATAIDINDPQQQAMYNKSCALCPLEERCEQNFPSKLYYVKGVMIGTPRIRFPRNTLFGPEIM